MLQNAHKELWALLSWANPGSLSDWTSFERHYVNPLKYGQKKDCTDIQLAKVGISYCDCCVARRSDRYADFSSTGECS